MKFKIKKKLIYDVRSQNSGHLGKLSSWRGLKRKRLGSSTDCFLTWLLVSWVCWLGENCSKLIYEVDLWSWSSHLIYVLFCVLFCFNRKLTLIKNMHVYIDQKRIQSLEWFTILDKGIILHSISVNTMRTWILLPFHPGPTYSAHHIVGIQ